MASITTNALDALLYINNGATTARWNFPAAVGSSVSAPAGVGQAVTLTYSFPVSKPAYASESGFQALSAPQIQAARQVLASIEAVANVDFVEVSGVGQLTLANNVQPSGQAGYAYIPSYGYSYAGNTIVSVSEMASGGDVWLNASAGWASDAWQPGQDGYLTLLHELGHALGLKHPFEASSNGYFLDSSLDNEAHTVMSYDSAPHALIVEVSGSASSYSWVTYALSASTLMPMDIEALQYLYGANTSTRSGNDSYSWGVSPEILETIWDGGGSDTINCSNQTLSCIINLQDGAYSSIALRQTDAEIRAGLSLPSWFTAALPADIYNGSNNLAIAKGAIIEHARGGSAADQLYGNAVANLLDGGAGNDSLAGYAGNDTLDGGSGSDTMSGGLGNDYYYVRDGGDSVSEASGEGSDTVYSYLAAYTLGSNVEHGRIMLSTAANLSGNALNNVLYAGSGDNVLNGDAGIDTVSYYYGTNGSGVSVSLASSVAQASGGSGSDTLLGIENLFGSNGADRLTGNAAGNALRGYDGNDSLDGGAGNDTLTGGAGNDYYYVRDSGDSVVEASAEGSDIVFSYLAGYTLGANVENGRVMSGAAANLSGNSLSNLLYAGSGSNVLVGGEGNDTVSYVYGLTAGSSQGVTVSLASTTAQATGSSGSDTLQGIENLYGSSLADSLSGAGDNNILQGLAGNDTLSGGAGDDLLIGGVGRDSLSGGSGNDVFDFNSLDEMSVDSTLWDVISDFVTGQDHINLATLDANTGTASNDSFSATLLAAAANFSSAGQLKFANGVLYGNTDADSAAEFAIQLLGVTSLVSSDLVL